MAGHRRQGANVPGKRPKRRRLSQLHQSTVVGGEKIIRVRHRSVFAAVHVERGECVVVSALLPANSVTRYAYMKTMYRIHIIWYYIIPACIIHKTSFEFLKLQVQHKI